MIENYSKYMNIWNQNVTNIEATRKKQNNKAFSQNARVNKEQHDKGDLCILDRTDIMVENTKNRELLNITMRPNIDHDVDWYCSLRQTEHDTEFDGLLNYKSNSMKPASRMGIQPPPQAKNDPKNETFRNSMNNSSFISLEDNLTSRNHEL